MPRYFFNTRIGDELIADPEGEELRDPDRAWEMARAMIRELLKIEGAEGGLLNAILEVTDDEGEIVLEFPFTEAILDSPDDPSRGIECYRSFRVMVLRSNPIRNRGLGIVHSMLSDLFASCPGTTAT